MRKKILSFLVFVMLLLTAVLIIVPDDSKVKAESIPEENEEMKSLNNTYIRMISENLSNVIFNAYDEGELRKGREYGSDGERFAALNIIKPEMIDIGLYGPLSGPEKYLQQLQDLIHSFNIFLTRDLNLFSSRTSYFSIRGYCTIYYNIRSFH